MMAKMTVKLSLKGIRELKYSPPVKAEVIRRAKRIAEAAGPGFVAVLGKSRVGARALVWTTDDESRKAEARDKVLTRALDAGR